MTTRTSLSTRLLLAALCLGLNFSALADTLLNECKRRIDSGDAHGAYALLEPLEAQRAGEPAFDYLLGLAAVESGRSTRAVFALERVLAVEPNNALARAEIARAYLQLGENRAAREEFERVKKQELPPEVTVTINRLLAMIRRAESANQPSFNGYIEIAFGSDSNVNSSTDATAVAVPLLGIATLDPDSVKTSDDFGSLAGGLAYRHPLTATQLLTGTVSASERRNRNDSRFDTTAFDGSVGWQRILQQDTVSLALTGSIFQRDGEDLRDTLGLSAQWQRSYDAAQATLFFQYFDISYPAQPIRDVDRFVLGAGYTLAFLARTVMFASFYVGTEMEKEENVKHLGHTLSGARIGAQHHFDEKWSLFANYGYDGRKYGGSEPLFSERRSDDQTELNLGVDWSFHDNWKAGIRASHVKNHSNIEVFEYSRGVYSFILRSEF